jgi:uncharacterized membrane protein
MTAWLVEYREVIAAIHVLGVVIGLGGASIADFFFFKFLKDLRISPQESETLKTLSQVIWIGFAILLITGIGLVLANPDRLLHSDKFLVKVVILTVILINGAFLNFYVTPKLVSMNFGDEYKNATTGRLRRERRTAFALGAISATSWYSAFILGSLRFSPLPFWPLLSIYFLLLAFAVSGSQIMERRIARKGWKNVNRVEQAQIMRRVGVGGERT